MKIAVLPGDGIGPEIVGQAQRVLEVLRAAGLPIETEAAPIGGAGYDAAGDPLPPATLALAQAADAILLGAVGGPQYDTLPRALRPEQGLLGIRKALGLFANLRPAMLYPELAGASTLKPEVVAGLDIMIMRELTGDIYFGQPRGRRTNAAGDDEGFDTMHYSEPEIERIARVGFETARKRSRKLLLGGQGQRARHQHPVARSGHGDGAGVPGRRAVAHVRRQRRDAARAQPEAVRRDRHRQHVRRHPVGRGVDARGLHRHAAVGVARRATGKGLYEPIHGSAPDIAGQDKANPLATILSLAMMFRYTFARADVRRPHRGRRAHRAARGPAHRRHRAAGRSS